MAQAKSARKSGDKQPGCSEVKRSAVHPGMMSLWNLTKVKALVKDTCVGLNLKKYDYWCSVGRYICMHILKVSSEKYPRKQDLKKSERFFCCCFGGGGWGCFLFLFLFWFFFII